MDSTGGRAGAAGSGVRPKGKITFWGRAALLLAALLHLAVGVVVAAGGLIMPGWAVAGLAVVWGVGTVVMVRRRRTPPFVLAVPVVTTALWLAVAVAGGAWLGWTA